MRKLKIIFPSLIVFAFILFILFQNIKNNKKLFADFTLAEAMIINKFDENNENYYVSIQVPEYYEGWEEYFITSKSVKLKSEEYYKLIPTGTIYESLWIGIEISYAEAKANELLDYNGEVDINKVLDNQKYTRKYCTILSMQHD